MPTYNSKPMSKKTSASPVSVSERLEFIDILRGFAVLGILVVNMASFAGTSPGPSGWESWIDRLFIVLSEFLIRAKFYSLFSFLFGWGMAIQLVRSKTKNKNFVPVFLRRTFILFIFGTLHSIYLWRGDILTAYAIFGFLLLLFRNRSEKFILISSALCLIYAVLITLPVDPINNFFNWYNQLVEPLRWNLHSTVLYSEGTYQQVTQLRFQEYVRGLTYLINYFGNVFAMFLLGLYVGKKGLFRNIDANLVPLRKIMWLFLFFGVIFNAIFVSTISWLNLPWREYINPEYFTTFVIGTRTIGAPALTLFYVTAVIFLVRSEKWYKRLQPLANVGRMALSNYILHSLLLTYIFYGYGWGLYGKISPTIGFMLTLFVYFVLQIKFSKWWLDRYHFGPLEWLWRTLTYGKRQPLLLRESPDNLLPIPWVEKFNRLNPARALLTVWGALSIWAVTLFYVFSNLPASTISSSADSIPLSDILQTPQANGDPSSAVDSPSPIATPVTQPVIRQPGPLVAAGDLSALASAFEVDSAMDHINTLASPRYAGRYVGSPGGFAAGDYIAQQFAEYGLQPAGDNGTFYQSFPIPYTKLSQIPTLAVISPDGVQQTVYTLHQDFSVIVNSYLGTGLAEGEVVWANNCDASDFYGLDVVGKILLCRNGSSVNAGRNAVEHGASGLLLLINSPTFPFDFGSTYQDNWVPSTIPALRVSSKVAESILRGSGKQVSDLSITFSSFELNTRVRIEVSASTIDACPDQICQGRNILGVMPGSDPLYAGDVLIIGGHYDHLGDTPDQSLLWAGANDNASGIAVLLEIARVWQAQGYVPRRTVLFAAWDAEELGLIGSTYYVANPVYPLTSTLGMLQLDMVGAGGDTLNIDGIAGLEQQVSSAAESLGIPFELTNFGRSDHVPFLQAGVPASLLIWYTDDDALPEYHRPIDTPSTIDPDKLMQVGQVAAITLLSMADGEPQLDDMLYRRAQAVLQSDLTSFLQTSAPGQEGFDRLWFEDILTFSPISIDIQASAVNVNGHNATALVDFTLEYPNPAPSEESQDPPNPTTTKTFSLEAKFIRTESGWLWAGPNLSPPPELSPPDGTLPSPPSRSLRFDVYSHPQVFEDITGLGELAAARYRTFAKLLGLPEDPHAALYLYPSSEALRADTLLSLLPGTPSWIAPGVIKMVYSDQIMEDGYLDLALSQLLLAQAGLTAGAAPWLWDDGLSLAIQAQQDFTSFHTANIPRLYTSLKSQSLESPSSGVTSWAAVDYIRQKVGWRGLGQFIATIGRNCRIGRCATDAALNISLINILGLDSDQFNASWKSFWLNRLDKAQADIDSLLTTRVSAVDNDDKTAFINTVDSTVPNLLVEQNHWFDNLSSYPPSSFSLVGKPLVFFSNGSILAEVTWNFSLGKLANPVSGRSVSTKILLTRSGSKLLWAGTQFDLARGSHVSIYYSDGRADLAHDLLSTAEEIYAQAASNLGLSSQERLVIKLYSSPDNYRTSIFLPYPITDWTSGWTHSKESVKLLLLSDPDADASAYHSTLATQISRHQLYKLGVTSEWLIKGMTAYHANKLNNQFIEHIASGNLYRVYTALTKDRLLPIDALPQDYELNENTWKLETARAWDTLRYISLYQGESVLLQFVRATTRSSNLDNSLRTMIGQDLADFETSWAASLTNGHVNPSWAQIAESFDSNRLTPHINYLTSPEMNGRPAGSPQARLTADYIAAKFAEYGLIPAGDPAINDLAEASSSDQPPDDLNSPSPNGLSYFQRFPIEYAQLLTTPLFALTDASGAVQHSFVYRTDFLTLLHQAPNGGFAEGELVWVLDPEYTGLDLTGKIVVRIETNDLDVELANAMDHGAVGLVVIRESDYRRQKSLQAKTAMPVSYASGSSIPVLALGTEGYRNFLKVVGQTIVSLNSSPPTLPLGVHARIHIPLSPPQSVQSANILGVLPGSDPSLMHEVIVLGAHYDHVGDDPDTLLCNGEVITDITLFDEATCQRIPGYQYTGTNDNASGIAMLLEIARLWQASGYQPQRSILFAAWGAQEPGQIGSNYYLENPAYPLASTIASIHLDALGGGGGYYLLAQGTWETAGQLLFGMTFSNDILDGRLTITQQSGQSDHLGFVASGIPSMLVSWAHASENNFPDEIADQIEPYRLEIAGRLLILTLMSLTR